MILDPPWRGMDMEIRHCRSHDELVRRSVAYGLELARGIAAEEQSKTARAAWARGIKEPTEAWQSARDIDVSCARLLARVQSREEQL